MHAVGRPAHLTELLRWKLLQHVIAPRSRAAFRIFALPQVSPERKTLDQVEFLAHSQHIRPYEHILASLLTVDHRAAKWQRRLRWVTEIPPNAISTKSVAAGAELRHLRIKLVLAQEARAAFLCRLFEPPAPARAQLVRHSAQRLVAAPHAQNGAPRIHRHRPNGLEVLGERLRLAHPRRSPEGLRNPMVQDKPPTRLRFELLDQIVERSTRFPPLELGAEHGQGL
mmetsp:Transcript_55789/g.122197  ORF Transcript_55789/g.122197 Transcript_55789/m.122197 type:complete len:226 (+) Transcript_55789:204-881(+)